MEQTRSIPSEGNSEHAQVLESFDAKEGIFREIYEEMRKSCIEVLKVVDSINNFESDQEDLVEYVEEHVLPLNNPYQELFFNKPEDLLRLVIINWSPVNGKVMGDYNLFLKGVIAQLEADDNQLIPSVDILCEIIKGAGLHYIAPDLSLGGTNKMGKTIRKNQTNKSVGKMTNKEQEKLVKTQRAQAITERANAVAKAKEKAAEAKEAAKLKALEEAEKAKAEAEAKEAEEKALKDEETKALEVKATDPEVLPSDEEKLAQMAEELTQAGAVSQKLLIDAEQATEKASDMLRDAINETQDEIIADTKTPKKSFGKKLAIGAVAVAALVGTGYVISKLMHSDEDESYDFQ